MKQIIKLINKIRRLFGISKANHQNNDHHKFPDEPSNVGITGQIDADVVILRDHDRVVLSIDYDFNDILGWVEWDVQANKIDLVQKSGSVAELRNVIPASDVSDFVNLNKVFVITRYNQEKIMHNLSLVVRN